MGEAYRIARQGLKAAKLAVALARRLVKEKP